LRQRGAITDVVGACAAFVLIVVVLSSAVVRAAIPPEPAFTVLTLAAAAAGAAGAILAGIVARLTGDPRPSWIAAALVLYCLVVLPWTTVADQPDVVQRASRLVAYLGALVVLLLAIRPPRLLRSWGAWVVVAATALLGLVVLGLPESAALRWLVEGPVVTVVVLGGWTAAAAAFVADGYRRASRPRLRLGLGLVILAAAQLYRVAAGADTTSDDLAFAALRLAGLVVVLVALAQLAQLALRSVETAQWRQQEELTAAALHMERAQEAAAERDHELRNGLAGLAGITHLLCADTGSGQHDRLKHAVLAELGRLHAILDGGVLAAPPDVDYAVEPVLAGLVALRAQHTVTLAVAPDLTARGDPAVLAQIVTNLLVNCDRHAPGATVTVTAERRDRFVAVEVRDEGPGLPPEAAQGVPTAGTGLGLPISRRLAATQGGLLTVRTVTGPSGCLATLSVPSAAVLQDDVPVTDGNLPPVFHRT
jgi:two-component system, OmpR family, sensor kinase